MINLIKILPKILLSVSIPLYLVSPPLEAMALQDDKKKGSLQAKVNSHCKTNEEGAAASPSGTGITSGAAKLSVVIPPSGSSSAAPPTPASGSPHTISFDSVAFTFTESHSSGATAAAATAHVAPSAQAAESATSQAEQINEDTIYSVLLLLPLVPHDPSYSEGAKYMRGKETRQKASSEHCDQIAAAAFAKSGSARAMYCLGLMHLWGRAGTNMLPGEREILGWQYIDEVLKQINKKQDLADAISYLKSGFIHDVNLKHFEDWISKYQNH